MSEFNEEYEKLVKDGLRHLESAWNLMSESQRKQRPGLRLKSVMDSFREESEQSYYSADDDAVSFLDKAKTELGEVLNTSNYPSPIFQPIRDVQMNSWEMKIRIKNGISSPRP